ncbi:tuberin-like isoform X2 [Babylonia areolata]|uniref:tuberin-like isoform X2 n=1 Tax=Babylonia areolata TaxID=304850 RepID=UPI003FD4EF44
MSGKPPVKSEENLKDKLIRFFGRNKPTIHNPPKPTVKDFVITPQILKDIGPECPFNNRMRNLKELTDLVKHKKLEQNAPEALWKAVYDLVEQQHDIDTRHQALHFLLALIEGQLKFLGMLRGYFFNVIVGLHHPEDLHLRLDLFKKLSDEGKNLLDFEEETGPFLLKLMPDALTAGVITEFLQLLINVIKFNAAYIDEDIMSGLVQQTCMIQNRTRSDEDMKLCLQAMDAVICYSFLPPGCLHYLVAALCHIINKPRFCDHSWELMRKLLGTHLGHKTIYTLCCMMQDRQHSPDFLMLRGAVFTMGMALWGSRRIATLQHSPSSVLPSFYQVLAFNSPLIAYEVVLTLQRLVNKFGKELLHNSWETILDILQKLLHQCETVPEFDSRVSATVHDILTEIEALLHRGHFLGPTGRVFSIVETCAGQRPIESVCKLILYHQQAIHPGRDKWLQNLHQLLDKFYRQDTRTEVRKKALGVLSFIVGVNKHVYEVDLIDKLMIPHFSHIDADPDVEVRKMVVEIIISMAQGCSKDEFFDLISILEKIIRKPLHVQLRTQFGSDGETIFTTGEEHNLEDVKVAFFKVIEAFKHKLYTAPPSHAQRLYNLIIGHMQAQYAQGYDTSTAATMRKAGLELLLQLRSDSKHRVGLLNRCGVTGSSFSPYVLCTTSQVNVQVASSPVVPNSPACAMFTAVDYSAVLEIFQQCLKKEVDWPVLKTLLTGLPSLLENKTLVSSAHASNVIALCVQLCTMVSQRNQGLMRKLQRVPDGFKISDYDNCVLPVVSAMVAYHPIMQKTHEHQVIKCLEFGLVSGVAKVCVTSLRICSLEMPDQMVRDLPSVLLSLSKISATVSMAIPVLAFLSSIVRLPKLYANFNKAQYLSVFGIALPYTNPFKFSHYTVSLAHHVINIWFIRCRLPFRKGFVKYITRHLSSYVQRLARESQLEQQRLERHNQNSALRNRSGSEGAASRRRMFSGPPAVRRERPLPMDEKMTQFHQELMETAIDSFSRYAFGNMSNVLKRSPMGDFLLKDGLSETWLVGNKLVTVTTSGGGNRENGSMFCSKCLHRLQRSHNKLSPKEKRRRHKSAIFTRSISEMSGEGVGSNSGVSPHREDGRQTRDDMSVVYEGSRDDAAVQTGSSLSSGFDIESLGSMFRSWRSQHQDKSLVSSKPCPCWCSGWAEIVIRAASGNVAWIMRTENLQCQTGSYGDPSMPDITLLFSPVGTTSPDTESVSKLDSGSLKEEEYDTVHADIFGWETRSQLSPSEGDHEKQTTRSTEGTSDMDFSPSSLRRTSSSPSLLSSSTNEVVPVRLDEHHFARDRLQAEFSAPGHHHHSVQIVVDSSDSRTITAAQNFEGLDTTTTATATTPTQSSEGAEGGCSPTEGEMVQQGKEPCKLSGQEQAAEDSTATNTADSAERTHTSEGAGTKAVAWPAVREPGRSSSRLEAQLKEYDRQKLEEDRKRESGGGLSSDPPTPTPPAPPPTPLSVPAVPSLASPTGENLAVRGQHSPRGTGNSPRQVPVQSPDSSSSSSVTQEDLMELRMKKPRGYTIAVMTPAEATRQQEEAELRGGAGGKDAVGVVTPSEVFLQLYHTQALLGDNPQHLPLHVPNNSDISRSVALLDHILPYETHTIGVVYVGPGQVKDEKAILANRYGSSRYTEFIQGLGHIARLPDPEEEGSYTGGLTSEDGKFMYTWQDETMKVIFHIATLMRNRKEDHNMTFKKRHVGNDFVTIVYNDSGEEYKLGTLMGQFNFVNIVIRPLDHGGNAVTLLAKQDIADVLGYTHSKIISDTNLALLVRQIAVHCNLASLVLKEQSLGHEPFASNCLTRLRRIKLIRKRLMDHYNKKGSGQEDSQVTGNPPPQDIAEHPFVIEDFTDYT